MKKFFLSLLILFSVLPGPVSGRILLKSIPYTTVSRVDGRVDDRDASKRDLYYPEE